MAHIIEILCLSFILIAVYPAMTAAYPSGWCYQCDSRDPRCTLEVDLNTVNFYRIPCNGQCYTRIVENRISRGCSWEYGFMSKKQSMYPLFELGAMWIFCDTALCNTNANINL